MRPKSLREVGGIALVLGGVARLVDSMSLFEAEVPAALMQGMDELVAAPEDWPDRPEVMQAVGSWWAAGGHSVALVVPSVRLAGGSNVLLHPLHPDFRQVRVRVRLPVRNWPRCSNP